MLGLHLCRKVWTSKSGNSSTIAWHAWETSCVGHDNCWFQSWSSKTVNECSYFLIEPENTLKCKYKVMCRYVGFWFPYKYQFDVSTKPRDCTVMAMATSSNWLFLLDFTFYFYGVFLVLITNSHGQQIVGEIFPSNRWNQFPHDVTVGSSLQADLEKWGGRATPSRLHPQVCSLLAMAISYKYLYLTP